MKDYSHYKAYDLLQDDEFLEYCLRPDEESVRMWDRLVRADRAWAEEVEKAQQIIRNIHKQEQRMRPEEKVQVWEAIRRNCRESFRLLYRISTVAACLLLTLATAFWLYRMQAEKALTAIELVGKPAETGSEVFCGLGMKDLIRGWLPDIQVIEAGWYQRWEEGRLKITFLPAQHWSKRSLNDGGLRLWGAFMLQTDDLSVYYGGDTGYSSHFTEIEELFGAPDYALLGIGAYKPRWFMQANHISPYDSLTAASQMKARITIPMHYGTFDLSDEPLSDPPAVFAEEAGKRNIQVKIPALGEIVKLRKR